MNELFNKAISFGLGATIASKEKIQQLVDELVVRGELGQLESKDLVAGLVAKGEEQKGQIKQLVQEQVRKILDELNIATKQDLRELEERLNMSEARAAAAGVTDPQASTTVPTKGAAATHNASASPAESSLSTPLSPTAPTELP